MAARLNYTRASIYKFFPTPNAVLNELVQRHLERLEAFLIDRGARALDLPWQEAMRAMVGGAVEFYNRHPVARVLLLGRPVSDDSYRAFELTVQRLGRLTHYALVMHGIDLPKSRPDVLTLLVEIGVTCFRLSQLLHGKITAEYRDEAYYAMHAYLSRYVTARDQDLASSRMPGQESRGTRSGFSSLG